MTKNISILHPSWKRPKLAHQCYEEWVGKCERITNIEYILCLSEKDPTINEYRELFFRDTIVEIVTISDNGLVKQVNHAAAISKGNLLIAVSDDFSCPEHWDTLLLEVLEGKSDYVVKTLDGQQPWIMTLPMMDRAYYNRFGYIYHPDYLHLFGDTENTHVAAFLGKTIDLPFLFEHQHYTTHKNPKDEVNVANDTTWKQGEDLYLERLKTNFGIENPLPITLPAHHAGWLKHKGVAF